MGLFDPNSDTFHVAADQRALMRRIGLDARAVFTDPRITPWRTLPDRENCTLDLPADSGRGDAASAEAASDRLRLHVKRYNAVAAGSTPADEEQAGYQLLVDAGIPTAPLIAWGVLTDRRSFTIWQDLAGFTPGDNLVDSAAAFDRILAPTAELAAKLHGDASRGPGLHHRDLYLCHFMIGPGDGPPPIRLIDTARVRRLPRFLRKRWIVKDLAQFWYSTTKLPVTDDQRERWLKTYADRRGVSVRSLRGAILRKSRAIGRHDIRLNRKQPTRNVSIPK